MHSFKPGDRVRFTPFNTTLQQPIPKPVHGILLAYRAAGHTLDASGQPLPAAWQLRIRDLDEEACYNGWVINVAPDTLMPA